MDVAKTGVDSKWRHYTVAGNLESPSAGRDFQKFVHNETQQQIDDSRHRGFLRT